MKAVVVKIPVANNWPSSQDIAARNQVDSVMLWAPITLVYQGLDCWPAVFATPLIGF